VKRILASLGIAALLAVGLFAGKSVVAPQTAGACGFYLKSQEIQHDYVFDFYYYQYTNINFVTQQFANGCGVMYYHIFESIDDGSPATYETAFTGMIQYNGLCQMTGANGVGTAAGPLYYSNTYNAGPPWFYCGNQASVVNNQWGYINGTWATSNYLCPSQTDCSTHKFYYNEALFY
jgi:hypothetical protein